MEGCLVNPVLVQGAGYQTSQFDKGLENDFSGDDQTLLFETGRLAQFVEEYALLDQVETDD